MCNNIKHYGKTIRRIDFRVGENSINEILSKRDDLRMKQFVHLVTTHVKDIDLLIDGYDRLPKTNLIIDKIGEKNLFRTGYYVDERLYTMEVIYGETSRDIIVTTDAPKEISDRITINIAAVFIEQEPFTAVFTEYGEIKLSINSPETVKKGRVIIPTSNVFKGKYIAASETYKYLNAYGLTYPTSKVVTYYDSIKDEDGLEMVGVDIYNIKRRPVFKTHNCNDVEGLKMYVAINKDGDIVLDVDMTNCKEAASIPSIIYIKIFIGQSLEADDIYNK